MMMIGVLRPLLCTRGRLNGPSDFQRWWDEVKDETTFRYAHAGMHQHNLIEILYPHSGCRTFATCRMLPIFVITLKSAEHSAASIGDLLLFMTVRGEKQSAHVLDHWIQSSARWWLSLQAVASRSAGWYIFMRSISEGCLTPVAGVTHIEWNVPYPSRVRILKSALSNTDCLNYCLLIVCWSPSFADDAPYCLASLYDAQTLILESIYIRYRDAKCICVYTESPTCIVDRKDLGLVAAIIGCLITVHFRVSAAVLSFFRLLITSSVKVFSVSGTTDMSLNAISVVAYTSVSKVFERISSLIIPAVVFTILSRSASAFDHLCSYHELLRILNPVSLKLTTAVLRVFSRW